MNVNAISQHPICSRRILEDREATARNLGSVIFALMKHKNLRTSRDALGDVWDIVERMQLTDKEMIVAGGMAWSQLCEFVDLVLNRNDRQRYFAGELF